MKIIKNIILLVLIVIITTFLVLMVLFFINNKVISSNGVNILSLNVGILQCLIAVLGIGVALAAYVNFKSTQDKLKEIDKRLGEHDEKFKKDFVNDNSSDREELENQKKGGLINDL